MAEENGIAKVAAEMALMLWRSEKDSDPKLSEADQYLKLVASCASALRGKAYSMFDAL